jgi:hypothetical protein
MFSEDAEGTRKVRPGWPNVQKKAAMDGKDLWLDVAIN